MCHWTNGMNCYTVLFPKRRRKNKTFRLASNGAQSKGGGLEILYPAIPGAKSISNKERKKETGSFSVGTYNVFFYDTFKVISAAYSKCYHCSCRIVYPFYVTTTQLTEISLSWHVFHV